MTLRQAQVRVLPGVASDVMSLFSDHVILLSSACLGKIGAVAFKHGWKRFPRAYRVGAVDDVMQQPMRRRVRVHNQVRMQDSYRERNTIAAWMGVDDLMVCTVLEREKRTI